MNDDVVEEVIDYRDKLIEFQREQLERYHEYMLVALSNSNNGNNSQNYGVFSNFIPLITHIQENMENMPLESLYMFFETPETTDHGVLALIESSLCPDKENIQFAPQKCGSFVKYNNGKTQVTESVQIFAKQVCDYIHNFCLPHIKSSNDELKVELKVGEEDVLDTLCKKNLMRVTHLSNLLVSAEQVRLVKKVFSMLKSK